MNCHADKCLAKELVGASGPDQAVSDNGGVWSGLWYMSAADVASSVALLAAARRLAHRAWITSDEFVDDLAADKLRPTPTDIGAPMEALPREYSRGE